MMDEIVLFVATGVGLGQLPWSPGTFGSLLGIPLAWWMLGQSGARQLGVVALCLLVSIVLSHWAAGVLGEGDAPGIVVDEYLAFPIAVLGMAAARSLRGMVAAFVLFRLFDITKPPPIGVVEHLVGGVGIALDDVVAALYAWLVLAGVLVLWRRRRTA